MTNKIIKKKIYNRILITGVATLSTLIILAKKPIDTGAEIRELPQTTELITEQTSTTNLTPTNPEPNMEVTTSESVVEEKNQAKLNSAKPRTVIIKGVAISYESEIGQAGIDANHNIATTWGGDFNPNGHTLIAGHDDGPMGIIKQLSEGDIVTITDLEGNEYQYRFQDSRVVSMLFSGKGTGFVESKSDAEYIKSQFSSNNLNLQTCVETRSDGYSIVFVTLTKI